MLFLLACHPRPGLIDACEETEVPTDPADDLLGYSATDVRELLASGREAVWSATGEVIRFDFAGAGDDIALVERGDTDVGGCPRTGPYLRIPTAVAVTASEFVAEWTGVIEAWSLEDVDLVLDVGREDAYDVSLSLESEAEGLADQDAEITGWGMWLTGAVNEGTLTVEVETFWGEGDTADQGEEDFTIRDGAWTLVDG